MITAEATVAVTACPACRTQRSTPVGGSADGFDEWVQGRNFRQPPYEVCYCEVCGLYFKTATLSPEAFSDYYRRLDSTPFDYDGRFPTDRILTRRLATLADGSHVLDYGCSTGRILRSHVARLRCYGVEPNAEAARIATERGIRIVDRDELWNSDQTFDAVLLTDVYEHLIEPLSLLTRLAHHVAPGGWLGIVTGNADAVAQRPELASFWYFRTPAHVSMLSDRHLLWLAQRLNLTLSSRQRCSHYSPPYLLRLRQHVQAFSYRRFRTHPNGLAARTMRLIPRLRSAERWSSPPAFTCGRDHIVAFFEKGRG